MSAFSIDLGGLKQGASRVALEAEPEAIGLTAEGWTGPVLGDLRVERSGDRVSVRGELSGTARLECVRCLKEFELSIALPFEVFAERAGTGHRRDEEALERDDYMTFHDGRALELGASAREALLIELPIAPHCREHCRGLCPRCGADLNEGPCACGASDRDVASERP